MTTTETQVITCDCKVCGGKSARMKGTDPQDPTTIHNLVGLAHSPMAQAESVQRFGPWAV